MTDVIHLDFLSGGARSEGFWRSLLYAVLEGASEALSIRRQDLDGCLHVEAGSLAHPVLVLLDSVPGGAGHVARVIQQLPAVLEVSLRRLNGQCGCSEETSCYGCLRNFGNQFWHDQLSRGEIREYLLELLGHVQQLEPRGNGETHSDELDLDLFPRAWQRFIMTLRERTPDIEVDAGEDVFDGDRVIGSYVAVLDAGQGPLYAVDASRSDATDVQDALLREGRRAVLLDASDDADVVRCLGLLDDGRVGSSSLV